MKLVFNSKYSKLCGMNKAKNMWIGTCANLICKLLHHALNWILIRTPLFDSLKEACSCQVSLGPLTSYCVEVLCRSLWPFPPLIFKVLARILKIPVQNSNYIISARQDLATNLLQIPIPTTFSIFTLSKRVIYTSAMT